MYAITSHSFRVIDESMPLAAGETRVQQLPQQLLVTIRGDEARRQRVALLRASDWTQGEDCQLTPELKAALAAYRQKLRDLPAQPEFPDCGWPVPPTLPAGAASVSPPGVTGN
ncbi:TPA: phage tail assembly chaperone [Stenotrophomonas maltophilia]|nr:phage tail assembly chaperone [Stenotrophomonas maltophilia]